MRSKFFSPALLFSLFATLLLASTARAQQIAPQSLAGTWRFALDRDDSGQSQKLFTQTLPNKITLPGILQSQNYGDEITATTQYVAALPRSDPDDPGAPNTLKRWWLLPEYEPYTHPGNIKVPYLSQPIRHYLGVAWYQRDITIPQNWSGKITHLFLERPRWQSTIYIDDTLIGTNNSLVAPHEYELGMLASGQHRLTIRLDNRMSVFPGPPPRNPNAPPTPGYRPDGHSVSDALGQTWNGIAGRIELSAHQPVWIEDVQVFPNFDNGISPYATFHVTVENATGKQVSAVISSASLGNAYDIDSGTTTIELKGRISGNNITGWDEFHPVLQHATVQLATMNQMVEQRDVTFGLRNISSNGRQLLLNGHEINIRGTHSGGDFPLTGYPATDVASWKKIIQTCKDYGLNAFRFHSWCPPDAAFQAADELGFYIQPECGMWNNFSNPGMPEMLEAETQRMQHAYGNHPSYLMLSPSNEPAGNYQAVLPQWAARWAKNDPRRLYAEDTGRAQPNAVGPTYGIGVIRGNGGWFGKDYARQVQAWNIPVLGHEVGQWCAYPDFDLIKKFTGYLHPGNYEIFRDSAQAKGILDRNHEFAKASGKFQVQCYKEEIEANLRTPGLSGFQLLDLHDYIGQGGTLIGILDPFWESKGYVTPEQFRQFCSPIVPLARMTTYIYRTTDAFNIPVEIANYSEGKIFAATTWKIIDLTGKTAASGTFDPRDIPLGEGALCNITTDLSKLPAPQEYRLVVGVSGTLVNGIINKPAPAENSWNFWLYPAAPSADAATANNVAQPPPAVNPDIFLTNHWSEAQSALAQGKKVLFTPGPQDLGRNSPQMKNVPIFWNRLMNPSAAGDAMLGLWVDNKHPALAQFPTENFSDWQWISMVNNVRSININAAPQDLRPIVSAIDDWSRNDKLAVLMECKVGQGRLLISAINILTPAQPAAQQLRNSLLNYMAGESFQPKTNLTPQQVIALFPGPNAAIPATRPFTPGANPGDIIEGTPPPPPTRP